MSSRYSRDSEERGSSRRGDRYARGNRDDDYRDHNGRRDGGSDSGYNASGRSNRGHYDRHRDDRQDRRARSSSRSRSRCGRRRSPVRSQSRPKSRPLSRSRSRSPPRSKPQPKSSDAKSAEDTVATSVDANPGEVTTRVIDGAPNRNGDKTWLAEVYVPRPLPMRPGTICVRGPLRFDIAFAEEDANRLVNAHTEGGYKGIQEFRNKLRAEAR
eukprot:TRINITY_DN64668_c0_g1_i1.p1 TRINITY_DN64668_c0_g1~~TRINITY_DN64668_c0_g1_i1.p1  ORF type:complete len:213 (+),score=29.90 TRINITY_DN64668_c0_g1_i1:82-720(+)